MREILLSQKKVALVSDHRYEDVAQYKWTAQKGYRTWYASRRESGTGNVILLHRYIMNVTDPNIIVDHVDRNGLNCQDDNLRICTHTQNLYNADWKIGKTGYRGVYKTPYGKYQAQVRVDNKNYHIGNFDNPVEAAIARDKKVRELRGDFAILNFPDLD